MPTARLSIELADETATEALGQQLARVILPSLEPAPAGAASQNGAVIYLEGDLGAGKTALARAFLRACGVAGRIKSPSYALLESYKVSRLNLYHIDFYRFNDPRELVDAGLRELFRSDAIILAEWPDKAAGQLPTPDLTIRLSPHGMGRLAEVGAQTERGASWLSKWRSTIQPVGDAR